MADELYERLKIILKRGEGYIHRFELAEAREILEKEGYSARGPESHEGGELGPSIKHLSVSGRGKLATERGKEVKVGGVHIFITPDRYDPRLKKEWLLRHKSGYKPKS